MTTTLRSGRGAAAWAAALAVGLLFAVTSCAMPLPELPRPGSSSTDPPRVLDMPLEFRPVRQEDPGPCPSPGTYTGPLVVVDPHAPDTCLVLDSSLLTVRQLRTVAARFDDHNNQWVVEVAVPSSDAMALEQLTRAAANAAPPQNRVALVLGVEAVSVPAVTGALPDGLLQISGGLSHQEALDLQTRLGG